jgi:hypothetical protein
MNSRTGQTLSACRTCSTIVGWDAPGNCPSAFGAAGTLLSAVPKLPERRWTADDLAADATAIRTVAARRFEPANIGSAA